LETSGPVQACNAIALPYYMRDTSALTNEKMRMQNAKRLVSVSIPQLFPAPQLTENSKTRAYYGINSVRYFEKPTVFKLLEEHKIR